MEIKPLATIKSFCKANGNLFQKVQTVQARKTDLASDWYIFLNYKKILKDVSDYIDGFVETADSNPNKIKDMKKQVIPATRDFFDKMFSDKSYKIASDLEGLQRMNAEFLKGTKELQDKLDKLNSNEKYSDNKLLHQLIIMCDNQYKKLGKVCHDDMSIYLWLSLGNNSPIKIDITDSQKTAYNDRKNPVVHPCSSTIASSYPKY